MPLPRSHEATSVRMQCLGWSHPQPRFSLNSPRRVAGCRCRHLVASQAHTQAPAPLPFATLPEALRDRRRKAIKLLSTSCPERPKATPVSSLRVRIFMLSSQCTDCKGDAVRLGIASISTDLLARHHASSCSDRRATSHDVQNPNPKSQPLSEEHHERVGLTPSPTTRRRQDCGKEDQICRLGVQMLPAEFKKHTKAQGSARSARSCARRAAACPWICSSRLLKS